MKTIFPLLRSCMALMACSLLWTVTSCSDDDPSGSNGNSQTEWSVQKVAVVLPLSSSALDRTHYERTAQWFTDNFRQAQAGCDQGITLELEWYDEDTEDLSALAAELASRPELAAMVGPQRSTSVEVMGSAFASAEKPMIVPVASSEEIIRKFSCNEAGSFSDTPFLWSLTETDISQSEVMLSIVTSTGGKSIALLTPDDVYGKTFAEWMPFLANELGIELLGQYRFTGASDFRPAARQLLASGADFALCICDDDELTAQLLQLRQQAGDSAPRLLFSDGALSSKLLKQGVAAEGIEGVAMYADPSSGFQISYEERFQELPTMSEAQLYDALLLAGFAAFYCQHTDETNLNKAIQTITSQRDSHGLNAWDEMGMTQYLTQLEKQHYLIDFRGASGEIKFDAEAYTSVLHSTYVHWVVHDGKLVALDYASSDGNRTEGTLASWNWRAQSQQAIDDEETDIHYGELHDRWALLVAGSESWNDYRHQSDVLNVYQLLKRQGWDDDHIILVMRDNLAYHGSNPQPGEIYASVGGDNLYQEVQIDYRADTLSIADICRILRGERSSHLPVVVESDLHSNLFLYWSGHGSPGYFSWLDAADRLTTDMLSQTLAQMQAESRYRKLLICTEPCFSSSVVKAAEGIPGVLSIASASETEYSFADNYSVAFRAWLSDRFSNNLVECMSRTPGMTYCELYTYLVSHTVGSHVKVFNAPQFGNLYRESPKEFFVAGQ